MSLSKHQTILLEKIVALATDVLDEATRGRSNRKQAPVKRIRRSGKELAAFRRMLKAERKKGAKVVDLAEDTPHLNRIHLSALSSRSDCNFGGRSERTPRTSPSVSLDRAPHLHAVRTQRVPSETQCAYGKSMPAIWRKTL